MSEHRSAPDPKLTRDLGAAAALRQGLTVFEPGLSQAGGARVRYMLRPGRGGTEIIDKRCDDRVVALVSRHEEAAIIMAYLNGHGEIAARMHAEFTLRLDRDKDPKDA